MRPVSEQFADWILASDEHGQSRLPLLRRAEAILAGRVSVGFDERVRLVAALERWRYQHLNRCRADAAAEDLLLAETLDLTANDLAGRAPRAPRATRAAVSGQLPDSPSVAAALAQLDSQAPLSELAAQAQALTAEHFRVPVEKDQPATCQRRVLMYAPLYLSSHCINHCLYCGFRYPQPIQRRHLDVAEAIAQAQILQSRGFRHILLVAGDFPRLTSVPYFAENLRALASRGVLPSVEIAPQSVDGYEALVQAGAVGVTLYQETYDTQLYDHYHPRGSKVSYDWRLEGLDRAAEAGMRKLGLGVLLGLAEPYADLAALIRHGQYLSQRHPHCTLAFSLPRIHEAPRDFHIPYLVDDETFVRMYCALRIAFPRAELVLSTRETPAMRRRLVDICITQLSAGSSTAPGGYAEEDAQRHCGQQFPVCDARPASEVTAWLQSSGLCPVWDV